jgi:hypothetical protein
MSMSKRSVLAVLLAAGAVTGCSIGADTPGQGPQTGEIHLSRTEDYADLTELAAASSAVVKVKVRASAGDSLNGIPTTVTTVRVIEVVSGDVPGSELSIQQFGNAETRVDQTAPILQSGHEYLLFVKPFHLKRGNNTGLYTITGDRGEYRYDEQHGDYRLKGGEEVRLPATLSTAEVKKVRELPLAPATG